MNTSSSLLARIRYWEGQLLSAQDFQRQIRAVAELGRQHNRAVHSAYGIAIGLSVGEAEGAGLSVSCGMAYDCSGSPLILSVAQTVSFPQPAITAPATLMLERGKGAPDAELRWRSASSPGGNGVAIARILPGTPMPSIDTAFRPIVTRPLARPRIATGATVSGDTAWSEWTEDNITLGVQTTVDTSTYGFTTTPNYFAQAFTDQADFLPAWFVSIADAKPDSFTLRLFTYRMIRERFDILDPKATLASTPTASSRISLTASGAFAVGDFLSRLLPITSEALIATSVKNNIATLTDKLDLTDVQQLVYGSPPRITTVVSDPKASNFAVTVDTPAAFAQDAVVAKTGSTFASARPAKVLSVDDSGLIELSSPMSGLVVGDQLGVAQNPSLVTAVGAGTVTLQNPSNFQRNDIVVCVDGNVSDLPPAQITNIAGDSDELLTVSPASFATLSLIGTRIAVVQPVATVKVVDTGTGELTVQVDASKLFRAGDVVARTTSDGRFGEPALVRSTTSKSLVLSQAIAALQKDDILTGANFQTRGTILRVLSASPYGTVVQLQHPELFPVGSYVVALDDTYAATSLASVIAIATGAPGSATLYPPVAGLQAYQVLALCSFPATVAVRSIDAATGLVEVTPAGSLKTGDTVGALQTHPGIAMVVQTSDTATGSTLVKLTMPIPSLTAGDMLSVLNVGGAVAVTSAAPSNKVTLIGDNHVRTGDFLGLINGWREPSSIPSVALAISTSGTDVNFFGLLDGAIKGDIIGLASVDASAGTIQLRLKTLPKLSPGNEALLSGPNILTGETQAFSARVQYIEADSSIVGLAVEGAPGPTTLRPEDITATILLLNGSPLMLVQQQNVYATWLACESFDPRPIPCEETASSADPCAATTAM